MKPTKIRPTLFLQQELLDKLSKVAEDRGVSISKVMAVMIEDKAREM